MDLESFPELGDEALLVERLALSPLKAGAARRYARRKYLSYFFVATFALGLPLVVFAVVGAGEWGLPRGLAPRRCNGGRALGSSLGIRSSASR